MTAAEVPKLLKLTESADVRTHEDAMAALRTTVSDPGTA